MPDTTQLASGVIDGRDQLQILLVQPYRRPALVQILWPGSTRPTVVDAGHYPNTAATVMGLLAEASVTLAATRVYKR
ncbi:MAG: hypothetical protein ACJ72Y_06560, partial [Actinomycetes bacterium]